LFGVIDLKVLLQLLNGRLHSRVLCTFFQMYHDMQLAIAVVGLFKISLFSKLKLKIGSNRLLAKNGQSLQLIGHKEKKQ
jgi:hypothetical protein